MNPFDAIKVIIGGLLGVALIGLPISLIAYSRGDTNGYQRHIAEVAAASMKAELERKGDDAALANTDDYNLCLEYLGDRQLPTSSCDRLRGVESKRP